MQYTRPHEAEPSPHVVSGTKPGGEAVILAYYRLPEVGPADCLTVSSDCLLACGGSYEEEIVEMHPDPAGYLCDPSWNSEHRALWAEVTDVFCGDTPLFYLHVCRQVTPNADPAGVRVFLADGRDWPPDKKYLVELRPEGRLYRVFVYTNFLRDDDYAVSYVTTGPDGAAVECTEPLYPLPLALPLPCEGAAGFTYRVLPGSSWDTIRIAVGDTIIRDTRVPVPFRYAIKAEVTRSDGRTEVYWSPKRADVVFNQASLLDLDADRDYYRRGRKVLGGGRRVAEIMQPYLAGRLQPGEQVAVRYSVVADNGYVEVSCRPDGEGPAYAATSVDTGRPPAVVSATGRKWKYVEYTAGNLERLGLRGLRREVKVIASLVKGNAVVSQRTYTVATGFGFGQAEVAIEAADFAGAGDYLKIELANLPAGIDVQLVVGGAEQVGTDGDLVAPWDLVKTHGQARVVAREVYRPGCFVRVYAVKLVKSVPVEIALPEAGRNEPWTLRLRHGTAVKELPGGRERLVYGFFGEPRYRTVTETSPALLAPDLLRLRLAPVLATPDRTGRPANIYVRAGGESIEVEWCDVQTGLVKLARPVPSHAEVSVTYSYRADWLEYPGYTSGGRFYRLDFNPTGGAVELEEGAFAPASFLGREVYLYLRPALLLTNVHRVEGEVPELQKLVRQGKTLVLLLRPEHAPLGDMPVEVRYAGTGEVVPRGSGETWWEFWPHEQGVIAVYNPRLEFDPLGRVKTRFCASYSYAGEWRVARVYSYEAPLVHRAERCDGNDDLLVGRVRFDFSGRPEDAVVLDARSRGGGIRKDLLDRAAELEPESRHYFDLGYWDGEPWQRSGVLKILLPREVKERGWPEEFMEKQISRHRAAGTLVLVDYWDGAEVFPARPGNLRADLVSTAEEDVLGHPQHLVLSTVME